uniref:Putative secreted protein n=1 Tax=Ixodes ricinus TaxID=34613 RepID=A0A6B0V5Y8_IXORI
MKGSSIASRLVEVAMLGLWTVLELDGARASGHFNMRRVHFSQKRPLRQCPIDKGTMRLVESTAVDGRGMVFPPVGIVIMARLRSNPTGRVKDYVVIQGPRLRLRGVLVFAEVWQASVLAPHEATHQLPSDLVLLLCGGRRPRGVGIVLFVAVLHPRRVGQGTMQSGLPRVLPLARVVAELGVFRPHGARLAQAACPVPDLRPGVDGVLAVGHHPRRIVLAAAVLPLLGQEILVDLNVFPEANRHLRKEGAALLL